MLELLKKISLRIASFFIAYLALVGYMALENPLTLMEVIGKPGFSETYITFGANLVFLIEVIKISARFSRSMMDYCMELALLLLTYIFSIIVGYSPENLGITVLIYLSTAVLVWVCGQVILILYKSREAQITEECTEIRKVE